MLDGVGPGAWADRHDEVELTFEGAIKMVPLRLAQDYGVTGFGGDPRGLPVVGADGRVGGTVRDLWVDRSEMLFRFIEVTVPAEGGERNVLVPMNFTRVGRGQVKVASILGNQFAQVPATRNPDQVSRLEEEKITAYYGGGTLYAEASRAEPLI
jgi:photosynthetic reaction center H subunit